MLLHLVDATGEDPVNAWKILRNELAEYGGGLGEKPEVVGLTKLDATPEDYAHDLADALRAEGAETVLSLTAVTGSGVTSVLRQLIGVIEDATAEEARAEDTQPWSP